MHSVGIGRWSPSDGPEEYAGETFARLNDEIAALKMGKSVEDGTNFTDPNLASAYAKPEQFYGMPPNSFPGQTLPPQSVHAPSVKPFPATS